MLLDVSESELYLLPSFHTQWICCFLRDLLLNVNDTFSDLQDKPLYKPQLEHSTDGLYTTFISLFVFGGS